MTYLPPEIIEHTLKFADSSTLQTCLKIPYIADMAQTILDKRYQSCLKILTGLGMDEDFAIGLITDGRLDLSSISKKVKKYDITMLTLYFNELNMLDLRSCPIVTDKTIKKLSQFCTSVEVICLNKCPKITDIGIITIAKNCPKLRVLMISHNQHITDISINFIVDKCPDMDLFNLCCCPNITNHTRELLSKMNFRIY